ncbi:MAG TPA: SGNH/GDSL hydrolase family protein, partial [Gemmatimonadaceae bacterium]|nr:SGNH/GDSL hydrolase family protein [Gemmatimonadaceae bacterium]
MTRSVIVRVASRVLETLRTAWLMVGITLLLFFGLEFGYRAWSGARRAIAGPVRPPVDMREFPFHGQQWYREFQRESARRTDRFDPYRGFWSRPMTGRWKNIDALGRRVTPQPPFDSSRALRVLMLGGSTMFGFNVPDSMTIPALTAARLAALGVRDVEVVNLGQGAFNVTQEAITLSLELARGATPAVALFFDGQNDIQALRAFGEPGHAFMEPRTQSLIDMGRRTMGQEVLGLGRHSAFVRRLQRVVDDADADGTSTGTGVHEDPALCGSLARYYRETTRNIEGIARERGFDVVFVQQPMLGTTRKKPSRWEQYRLTQQSPLFRVCAASLDSAMAPLAGRRYLS